MRAIRTLICVASVCIVMAGHALAAKRVALVIGNSRYEHVSQLPNPASDAEDIAVALAAIGFEVQRIGDAGKAAMEQALANFSDKSVGADIALVFYAGHGIEVNRQNYLIPTDAKLETDRRLLFETVSLDYVMAALDAVKGVRIVLLDACRNNPFAASMKATGSTRSIGRGLSRIEAPSGTLVSFAAKEGTVADDGDGRNSPFTSALLATLNDPVEIGLLFRRVRDGVLKATDGRQEPYVSASLPSDPIYLVEPNGSSASAPQSQPGPSATTRDGAAGDYAAAERVGTKAAWDAFLSAHPSGFYADLARAAREKGGAANPPPERKTPAPAPATPDLAERDELIAWYRTQGVIPGKITLSDKKEFEQALAKAQRGDVVAQFEVGVAYHVGKGVGQSYELARQWYEAASNQGYGMAQDNLSYLYENGFGVEVDLKKAARLKALAHPKK